MWKTQQLVSPCQKVGQEGEYLLIEGERERRQLAQKLHDGPIQHLIYISYQLVEDRRCFEQELNPDLQTQHAEIMAPTLEDIRREILDVVTQLRQLMGELDCAGLEKVGLTTALERYVLRLDCKEALELKLDLAENETDLPEPVAICLFRVAQQALHNVLQHAQARYAKLTLRFLEDEVILRTCFKIQEANRFNIILIEAI
jgi:signal transduction histidine kinase